MEFETRPDYTVEDFAAFWRGFREKRPGRKGARQPSSREMRRYGWLFLLLGGFVTLMYWPDPLNLQLPLTMAWPGPVCRFFGGTDGQAGGLGQRRAYEMRWRDANQSDDH